MMIITMAIQNLKPDKPDTSQLVFTSDQFKRPTNTLRGHKSIAKIRLDHRLTS